MAWRCRRRADAAQYFEVTDIKLNKQGGTHNRRHSEAWWHLTRKLADLLLARVAEV